MKPKTAGPSLRFRWVKESRHLKVDESFRSSFWGWDFFMWNLKESLRNLQKTLGTFRMEFLYKLMLFSAKDFSLKDWQFLCRGVFILNSTDAGHDLRASRRPLPKTEDEVEDVSCRIANLYFPFIRVRHAIPKENRDSNGHRKEDFQEEEQQFHEHFSFILWFSWSMSLFCLDSKKVRILMKEKVQFFWCATLHFLPLFSKGKSEDRS